MPDKWITVCRACGHLSKGKSYACGKCDSSEIKQHNVGPMFEDGNRVLPDSPGEIAKPEKVVCGKCGAAWEPVTMKYHDHCPNCSEPWEYRKEMVE